MGASNAGRGKEGEVKVVGADLDGWNRGPKYLGPALLITHEICELVIKKVSLSPKRQTYLRSALACQNALKLTYSNVGIQKKKNSRLPLALAMNIHAYGVSALAIPPQHFSAPPPLSQNPGSAPRGPHSILWPGAPSNLKTALILS